MKLAKIVRIDDNGTETLGRLFLYDDEGFLELYHCKTLELPWKDNQHNVSCIPKGSYICKLNKGQGKIDYPHYDVLDVPDRAGVKIHVGNYYTDIRGCILPGVDHLDINGDGEIDVTASRNTLNKIIEKAGEKFELLIL